MSKVRSKDTKPEKFVRKIVHGLGFRYRLHVGKLPGKPDLVFSSRSKVIFVNGCFWHGHSCKLGRIPKSRVDFWLDKISNNRLRDKRNVRKLKKLGWQVLILWECQLADNQKIRNRIIHFLNA